MFRKLMKNKKAQNTAEYAILISLVVAGIVAMQLYVQRGGQARIRDAVGYMVTQTNALGKTTQYEPYYLQSDYNVFTDETETQILTNTQTRAEVDSLTTRAKGGYQESRYEGFDLENGI